jgi:hypothetical protein
VRYLLILFDDTSSTGQFINHRTKAKLEEREIDGSMILIFSCEKYVSPSISRIEYRSRSTVPNSHDCHIMTGNGA